MKEWINVNNKLPNDGDECILLVEYSFVSWTDTKMENIFENVELEGMYNGSNWVITKGSTPKGFIHNKVVSWRLK